MYFGGSVEMSIDSFAKYCFGMYKTHMLTKETNYIEVELSK